MALRKARITVGTQRIKAGRLKPWQEGYTRAIREQMVEINKFYSRLLVFSTNGLLSEIRDSFRPIFDKSQTYVPKDTGALRDSGFFSVERENRSKTPKPYTRRQPVMKLGYAAGGIPHYAVKVHEDLEARHPRNKERAKFLELALREEVYNTISRIKRNMGLIFKKGLR